MALPRKLKNFNLFIDGESYAGLVPEITLPKLSRKTEEYVAGGMPGAVNVAMSLEALELQFTLAGMDARLFRQFGNTNTAATLLRFAGAMQDDATGAVLPVEIVTRGFYKELDPGAATAGEKLETKLTASLSYYKVTISGETVIEIDMVNFIEIIGGTDYAAEVRRAIGL
ncbi:major tail tube protein [Hylemonella gracilis str. Niagara R]|uniref:Major tail tube protein n=1 Tax=Hylemonella gracilis str. Niagara R TaxID=1458275 RepID=A0A016XHX8_9BURK|nr:phage major tail tube protein [Hylemonella gracilis]EYC51446.1 major tail tube protein [Hylemonella gracilis str. Niagara R]